MFRSVLIATLLASGAPAVVVDRVAVTVGRDVITETELLEEIRVTSLLNGDPLELGPDARREAADRLVDQHLIRRDMEIGNYPPPSNTEVDEMLRKIKAQRFHGDAEFRAALERYGVSEADLKAHLKWQLAALRFTEQRFQAAALPPPTGQEPSAERAAPEPGSTGQSPRTGGPNSAARPGNIDQQMDAWLRDARNRTRVVYMKEAFQ